MSNVKQRNACFSVTRIVIFVLICITVLTESPISDICAIISAAMWLWLPSLVAYELKLLNKWRS